MGSGGSSAHPCVVVGLSDFWTSFWELTSRSRLLH
jgi:hypothetical protein